ncbi:MAG: EAL domain-containing protein [Pseudomonadota bacterium]
MGEEKAVQGMNAWQFLLAATGTALAIGLSRWVSATGDASLVWPPLGLALGLVLARGGSGLLAVLAGFAVWVVATGQSLLLVPVASLEIAAGTAAGVLVFRGLAGLGRGALGRIARFYVAGVGAGATVSALVGAAGFHWAGLYRDMAFGELFFAFWVSESMGALLFGLLTRTLARDGFAALWPDRELAVRWLLVSLAVFGLTLFVRSDIRDVVVLLAGLLIAWPAMRARPAFLHLAVLLLMSTMLAVALSAGPMDSNRDVLELVLRIAGLTVLAQLLNAVSVERNEMLQRERDLARRDVLTGLGNERALRERLALLQGQQACLMMARIEDISSVADLLGAAATEELETGLARDLPQRYGNEAMRLDRGRFAILLPGEDAAGGRRIAQSFYDTLDNRLFRGEHDVVALRPTIAVVPVGDRDVEEVLLAANLALAMASTRTGVRIEVASGERDLVAERRDLVRRQEQVKAALQEQRFVLYAQPIVPLSGADDGLHCEILLRLRERDGSILPPGHFLPAAERAQLTGAIDRYVIERLLAFLAAQPQATAKLAKCAINLTGWSVSDPALSPWIRQTVQKYGIAPQKLCFEITESQAIASREHARRLIESLREFGASVSLDDFGTGLATFDYLKSFPFDYLKIDGGFIKTLESSSFDQAVVKATAEVARTMQLKTIAEFVENDALVTVLRGFGVDYAQGYGVGKPRPLGELLGVDAEA